MPKISLVSLLHLPRKLAEEFVESFIHSFFPVPIFECVRDADEHEADSSLDIDGFIHNGPDQQHDRRKPAEDDSAVHAPDFTPVKQLVN